MGSDVLLQPSTLQADNHKKRTGFGPQQASFGVYVSNAFGGMSGALRLERVRPARKTSAPSAANSFATAEPIEPPAPKTTALFPCSIGKLLLAESFVVVMVFSPNYDLRCVRHSLSLSALHR